MTRKKILLVDDHAIFLDGLRAILESRPDLKVDAALSSGREALERTTNSAPDLVITDFCMPDMDGFELVSEIRRLAPDVRIIVLSMIDDREEIRRMMSTGVEGYVLKKYARHELFHAVDMVLSGETYWSPEVCSAVVSFHRDRASEPMLTAREKEVLKLLIDGLTSREIAAQLVISERTVESHRKNLLRKTGSNNTAGLIRYAFSRKLV